ncbi:MAG TPA: hypothetical protein VIV55_02060 [Flavobacterium sp.]
MGQIICAIITDKKTDYNKDLVHFSEGEVVIIPIDINENTIEYFIREAENFIRIEEYLNFLKKFPDTEKSDSRHKHNIYSIIDIIETYQLDNFAIQYYTEWGDIPVDNFYLAVINSKIKEDSIILEDDKFDANYDNKEKYNNIIGLNFSWLANEERYYNYAKSEKDYLKNLK